MKRMIGLMVAVFVVALAAPAFAGSGGKCTQPTQVCLNHWAKGKDKGWAGMQFDEASGTTTVKSITAGSPAATAGFEVGDVLMTINGIKPADKEALKKAKGEWKVGQTVSYVVTRAGAEKPLTVTLAPMPPEVFASLVGSHMLESHVSTAVAEVVEPAGTKAVKAEKK